MAPSFLIQRCESTLGAQINTDLRTLSSAEQIAALKQLFLERHLLIFRDQVLSDEDQIKVARWFGGGYPPCENVYRISNVAGVGVLGAGELEFHSDWSFSPYPPRVLTLYAEEVVADATSTRFANSMHAVDRLGAALKARVESLSALHVFGVKLAQRNRLSEMSERDPRYIHPAIMTHPESHQPILYVNKNQTDCIVGLAPADSEALIGELFAATYVPENMYEHRWRKNDLLVWDNLALQHSRGDVSHAGPRTLRRVTIGEKGFYEMYPHMRYDDYVTKDTLTHRASR